MDGMDDWLSFSMHESLDHDLAIRRFCPARMELEQGEESWEEITFSEIELLSPDDDSTGPPHLAASEVDELVDSFINVDQDGDKDNKSHEKDQEFNQFQDDNIEGFSMLDDVFPDVPMMSIEGDELEMRSSFEDPEAVPYTEPVQEKITQGVDQGLHLLHLLLACAEALGCRDTRLAETMLGQIWPSVSPWGDSLQRVSYCFAMGLKCRLSHLNNVNANGTFTNGGAMDRSLIIREEKMEAFHLLHQTTPYIAFGFMAANEAICQAAQEKDTLHIIDLGMEHALQWPSLMRALASRPEGPPKLRITGLTEEHNLLELETSMKELAEEASSLGIRLEFNMISDPVTPLLLTAENLNLREGEALFFNSIMHLHRFVKESRGSLKAILQAIKKLNPALLTVVEQDANHNGPFFLGRFIESLHYYSAIFDSLEASLPRNSPQRMKIEKVKFCREICNIIAYEGCNRTERHERVDRWRRQLSRAGFQVMGLKCMSQARVMLSVYGIDGYTLATEKGCLLLGWKGRPIMLASAWQVHNLFSS
ncbi:hypothetical protein OIU77_019030 [Salix suchowensis]|uniref:Uncharacterized protein n=1 Tax=Salix suchowensis TaxID=1278906 RepID=A0ABQ9CIN2_9ROSI|nr:hypothetical protein OIU78_020747 [Salix suchowensis]KAJ6398141.1 hypothetical protein OIU77_019030 [Salix suchowensis]